MLEIRIRKLKKEMEVKKSRAEIQDLRDKIRQLTN